MSLTADIVKAKARQLGADLVGIAAGEVLDCHPPDPVKPQTPSQITPADSRSVIVLARRLLTGTGRLKRADDRHKQYSTELVLSDLEEVELSLVYFLEDHGFPSITVPPGHIDPHQYDPSGDSRGPISLPHAAVEAGLGTLGLNLMLLTPEFGPRVVLGAVLTSAPLQPDRPLDRPVCLGEECGRCLLACPADAIGHWSLDKERCAPYASPYGFAYLTQHVDRMLRADTADEQASMLKSKESFMVWQSILRGVGVYSGCTRCVDVCPVGRDYEALRDVQDDIPERTPEKEARLCDMATRHDRGEPIEGLVHSLRWIKGARRQAGLSTILVTSSASLRPGNPAASSYTSPFPPAPADLQSRNVLRYLKFYGPGAIIASVTVGTGETVFASRGGAIFGYSLLWCLVWGAVFKAMQTYAALRFIVLTGEHPVVHWARLPGPRAWFPISLAVISTITLATIVSALPKTLATLLVPLLGLAPPDTAYTFTTNVVATGCLLTCALAALASSYRVLETAQTAVVVIFVLLAGAAFVAVRPDVAGLARGMLIPTLPPYPEWIAEKYPAIAGRSVWVEVLTYFGMIGGSAADYVAYVSFARDKRWGRAAPSDAASTTQLLISPDEAATARTWLRAPLTDVILSFTMLVLITAVFMMLGATLLAPAPGAGPHGPAMLTVQARFLTSLHPHLFPVYVLGIVTIFGGTMYGAFEVQARAIEECWRSVQHGPLASGFRANLRRVLVALGLVVGTLLIWTDWDPVEIITPASLLAGVFACGLWCFAMAWTDRRALPPELRLRGAARILLLVAGVVMTVAGARAIGDYVVSSW